MINKGISNRLPATSTIEKRSKRRKSPVPAAIMIKAADTTIPSSLGSPRKSRPADDDELGDNGQSVQQEQVDDAKLAPELAEALQNQTRITDAGDGSQPQHHFLVRV